MRARFLTIIFAWILVAMPLVAQEFSISGKAARPLDPHEAFQMRLEPADSAGAHIGWKIAPGYYLYRDSFEVTDAAGKKLRVVTAPGAIKDDPSFGLVEVYHDKAQITVPDAAGRVEVTYQGCQDNGICYQPTSAVIDLPTPQMSTRMPAEVPGTAVGLVFETTPGLDGLAAKGTAWLLLAYLGFGIALAFTPCAFPMLPVLIGMLARQGEALVPARGAALSGVYALAMASAFGLIGAIVGWSGQNLQIALQSPWAIGAMALLFGALAMSALGHFDLKMPGAVSARISRLQGPRGSLLGAAILGFCSALILGPCVTAPLAGALLYIAQTGDVALGAAALFALGLGQGIPLVLAATFGAALLPRAGQWMHHVRGIFALVFLVMAIWLAGRILPGQATLALWAILLIGTGIHLGAFGREIAPIARTLAVSALVAGLLQAFGAASGGSDPLKPLASLASAARAPAETGQDFADVGSAGALRQALASPADRPAIIYVTADWCITCRGIERDLLPDPDIMAALSDLARVKVDVSEPNPDLIALMAELGVAGPPTMIFLDRERREVAGSRLIGTISAGELRRSARAAGNG
ncbi:protein-disulfide reductase DsbD [Paracoccus sp. MBLB3053]|uniref:Protein-disulfide reductase DsbD n=1 Tax=Paracoccus aurantius TaxID=3073814 RepID=A0ABU2HY84_9RHOB|nr:protein-disulfide reductase DsbD [Paracoccus sp. MBLB3053]MDS9470013.1 protein-disulfide reductase DsbD [Paracoccus sp. MBLB3053]